MFSTDLTNTSWKRANTIWKQQRAIFRNHQKARVPVLSVSPKKRRTSHLCQAKEPQNMALGETCSKAQRCTKAGHKSKRQLKMHYCSHCPEPSEQRIQLSSPQLAKHLFFPGKTSFAGRDLPNLFAGRDGEHSPKCLQREERAFGARHGHTVHITPMKWSISSSTRSCAHAGIKMVWSKHIWWYRC